MCNVKFINPTAAFIRGIRDSAASAEPLFLNDKYYVLGYLTDRRALPPPEVAQLQKFDVHEDRILASSKDVEITITAYEGCLIEDIPGQGHVEIPLSVLVDLVDRIQALQGR